MGFASLFGFKNGFDSSPNAELPEIWAMCLSEAEFLDVDILTTYSNILIDVLGRTEGIKDEQRVLLWDNCLKSERQKGLITLLADAMYHQKDLFIVFAKSENVLREADQSECTQIKDQIKQKGFANLPGGKVGIYISFSEYRLTKILKLYSILEYSTLKALSKSSNLSSALQFKLSDLRASVSSVDSGEVVQQAQAMAAALGKGRDILADAKDIVETATPDITSANTALDTINKKKAFYLRLPQSYIVGEQATGLSDTGQSDLRAIERGLKIYFFSIIKPVVDALFSIKTTFKSEDGEALSVALEVLRTFELIENEFLSQDTKQSIINKVFGLPESQKGDQIKTDEENQGSKNDQDGN